MKEGIEHVSGKEKEEGIEEDKGSYGAFMHGSTLTTLNMLLTCASNVLLYFHLCPKTLVSDFFCYSSINSFLKAT